jgi:hypothetical protein
VTTPAIQVDAFFDQPGLLAVRLAHQASRDPVRDFAARRPDHGRSPASTSQGTGLSHILTMGGILLLFGGVVFVASHTPSESTNYSSAGDGDVEIDNRPRDAAGTTAWVGSMDRLSDDLAPPRDALKTMVTRTLLDIPRDLHAQGKEIPGWLAPAASDADRQAYARAKLLAAHLIAGKGLDGLAVVIDLPGPQAVAAGAGLSGIGDTIFTMDNLPHPCGVVPSQSTLASALYWRPTILTARTQRAAPDQGIPVFVLDANRLAPYANEVDRFDNRSRVRLPSAAALASVKVSNLIYLRPTQADVGELDDLNQVLVEYAAAGITVRHLGLDSADDLSPPVTTAGAAPASTTAASSHHSSAWMWYYLGMSRSDAGYRGNADSVSYVSQRRAAVTSPAALDGGAASREEIFRQYPAERPRSTSQGGTWGRFFSSSSSSRGG